MTRSPAGIQDRSPVRLDGLGLAERFLVRSGARADRLVVRLMETLFLASNRRPSKHAQSPSQRDAFDLYSDPALLAAPERFFRPPPGPPEPDALRTQAVKTLPGGQIVRFRWASTYRCFDPDYQHEWNAHAENANAYVHSWVHDAPAPGERPRPAVVAIHGWGQGTAWVDERALGAAHLYRAGFDVHLFVLPFHGPRTPRGARISGGLFPSTSVRRNAEAMGQAIHDLRCFAAHLRLAAPDRPVGAIGQSLGGYTTALWASVDPGLSFAVPMIPLVSMADLMWDLGAQNRERKRAEEKGITRETLQRAFALHCPLSHAPRLPRERLLILAGVGDRICHPAQARALWEHWGHPRIHWFPGGHLLWFGRKKLRAELHAFLASAGVMEAPVPAADEGEMPADESDALAEALATHPEDDAGGEA